MSEFRVAVVGGGIGGIAAALSLLQMGVEVTVYEQAHELREIGAGVQISPNASRILHGLGLGDALAQFGVRPLAWHQRRWDDARTLLRTPLAGAMEQAFGFPHYQIHRADLLRLLLEHLPPRAMMPGRQLVGLHNANDFVELEFANGERATASLVVGADGIHSRVRSLLFDTGETRFAGCVCYRGLVPAAAVAHLDIPVEAQIWMGPGKHFVHYYVRGGQLFNFVAVIDRYEWIPESWTEKGDKHDALAAFAGWHPQIRQILNAVEDTFVWGLFDRAPMQRWSAGRVTLLGDACHAMLPFMAQGAAQAIEDGAALAACLRHAGADIASALNHYERLRLQRTAKVQQLAAANKIRFHLDDGTVQLARDAEMAQNTTDFSLRNVAWLYGHDAGRIDVESVA
ncbi:MAG: monooxygenase [Proteobacteria bacterium SG_bin9]|nr:MAG: monooxygenase [Proteobacteria bacterium SG_bin9]